jgi:sensor c-di-GMP phosphodiesterase-like protein
VSPGHRKLAAIVAGVLLAGGPALAFHLWLDRVAVQRGQDEVDFAARRTIALAESRIAWVAHALDKLTERGMQSCRPASLEAMREATFATTPIKEISVVAGNGRTLCTDLGGTFPLREAVIPETSAPAREVLIEVVRIGSERRPLVRIRRTPGPEKAGLAALVPPDLLIAQVATDGSPVASHVRLTTYGGAIIGELGSPPIDVDDVTAAQASLSSSQYGISATLTLWRDVLHLSDGGIGRAGTAALSGLALLLLGFGSLLRLSHKPEADNPVAEMERALAAGEFVPYYQPIVDIRSGRLRGAEVLMRWRKPDGTIVSPAVFIPLAESSGLIIDLTRALMRRVCRDAGPMLGKRPNLTIGFNLAARHFADDTIVADMREIFGRSPLSLKQIVLEVTERQPLENLTETRRVVAALQGLGVRIAIDDVGTGHSGLSYMLKLGVDIIKIDKLFIDSLGSERHSNTIVETLIDLAENMRMEVVAEGVERFEQVLHLRELGIRSAQGFVFSPPLPGSAFLQLVEAIDPSRTKDAVAGRESVTEIRVPPLRNLMPAAG